MRLNDDAAVVEVRGDGAAEVLCEGALLGGVEAGFGLFDKEERRRNFGGVFCDAEADEDREELLEASAAVGEVDALFAGGVVGEEEADAAGVADGLDDGAAVELKCVRGQKLVTVL